MNMTYGEIVQQVQEWEMPDVPALKETSKFKYIGQPMPRVDLRDKVIGAPIFGMDAEMPDMVYGAVVRPAFVDSKMKSVDTSKAEQMPGVIKIVKEEDFVGVIANSRMEAENAKNV